MQKPKQQHELLDQWRGKKQRIDAVKLEALCKTAHVPRSLSVLSHRPLILCTWLSDCALGFTAAARSKDESGKALHLWARADRD